MRKPALLLSYYARRDDGLSAYRALRRRGFRRLAFLDKDGAGKLHLRKPSRRSRWLWALACGLGLAALAAAVPWLSSGFPSRLPSSWFPALRALLGLILGGGAGWAIGTLLAPPVAERVLDEHGRWLALDESLIIVEAPLRSLSRALSVLREFGETEPSVFALHPQRSFPGKARAQVGLALPGPQLQTFAERMAQDHRVKPRGGASAVLLERLETARVAIHAICEDLGEAGRLEQSVGLAAEWLLDNEYIVQSHVRDVQVNLPKRFYRELPSLLTDLDRGLPRVFSLARELVFHTDSRLDRENIGEFLVAYQSVRPLTIGELWAMPLMLRLALVESVYNLAQQAWRELQEREVADFWAHRLLSVARRNPNQLFAILAKLAEDMPHPSPYFGAQLTSHLYDETTVLGPVQIWLERVQGRPLSELNRDEQTRQAAEQVSMGNAITSLRQLSLLDWREMFEEHNRVEQILRRDPSGVYAHMDFDTRNSYRQQVETLARGSAADEAEVAEHAVDLARGAAAASGWEARRRHVGTFLVGEGRPELIERLQSREALRRRLLQFVYRHHTPVYLVPILLLTALLAAPALLWQPRFGGAWIRFAAVVLLLGPASQVAIEAVNYLATRILPPRTLPKMDFEREGIPDAFRTLVVVPMILANEWTIRDEVEKLEARYLANPEPNLVFAMFSDFADADQQRLEEDDDHLKVAVESIARLNRKYGEGRFYLFHRERTWVESERKYIGWERKRGKLEELNRLIIGSAANGALVRVGAPEALTDVRFVITLDSDTQLPRNSARRMVETLAHPLNEAHFDAGGRVAPGTYTIIQPRVSPSLPSATATPFARLFTDPVGTDPYTRAVSDVYQDLSGEGSYQGKGIYNPRAFHRVLAGRFPEQRVLSHDLIEGAYVRTALASDIELFDEFPPDYLGYGLREHRWIRGDWQIAEWLFPRVPGAGGEREPNPLSILNQWKIFDNLRRSLLPAASVSLLILGWLAIPAMLAYVYALLAAILLSRPLSYLATWASTPRSRRSFSLAQVQHDLLRALAEAVLLPHRAALALDAILRVGYRRLVSGRLLLEWTPAHVAAWGLGGKRLPFVLSMGGYGLLALALGWAVAALSPLSLPLAAPWLALWLLSPVAGWLLTYSGETPPNAARLASRDLARLRRLARRTWRYFSDFVGPETSWLPPDNFQVSHQNRLAMRTSPTNIGLWMLSALGACDFGYLTLDQALDALTCTLETLGKLDRHAGHLFNWYDLETLAPLEPRYVSFVDSGNLVAALWSLGQGLEQALRKPILDEAALRGILDTAEIARETFRQEKMEAPELASVDEILARLAEVPEDLPGMVRALRELLPAARGLADATREGAGVRAGAAYWARQLERQVSAWNQIVDRYLGWVETLAGRSGAELARAGLDGALVPDGALKTAPSLADLAAGRVAAVSGLAGAEADWERLEAKDRKWLDGLREDFSKSKWLAGEMLDRGRRLRGGLGALSDGIDLGLLYDAGRRLFSIGLNLSKGTLDGSYYDLFASEARLGSFVAIAGNQVPVEHWLAMSRPYGSRGRHRVLLSWTGTMFEYLMPLLLQKTFRNSLLERACREAVELQIEYGRQRRVPWGVSESAYGDLDLNRTYQYKAFGVPWLGLKRGLDEELVVAPYATMLALEVAPRRALQNLKRLAAEDLLNDYGYYEAMDYSRGPRKEGERGVIVRAYMAHHQGMSLLAMGNLVFDGVMQERFHADPRVRAAEPLLYERIPVSPALYHVSTREQVRARAEAPGVAPSVSRFDTPHTESPKVQLLSNGRYGLMVTNAGGGYSRWKDLDITRWREDATRDLWGSFCYFRDVDTDRLWSNTYHPVGTTPDPYEARFPLDRAEFRRTDFGIETETEIIVSPEDDVEIRRITLVNHSLRARRIELTSYVELALAAHAADRQHPAFNKLFIKTEVLEAQRALLACRRPKEGVEPIFVAHWLVPPGGTAAPMAYETDRRVFVGRGRTLQNPMAVRRDLSNTAGFVLDPVFSLRRNLRLAPGERLQLSILLGAAETREAMLGLVEKYSHPMAVERAFELAWASAQLELRLLRIQPDEARRFQQLAGSLLYPGAQLRAPGGRIRSNHKGQSGLWAYGISGDLPIVLVAIGDAQDLGLVRQLLQAQTYLRHHGLKADLVILNEEAGGYDQPLQEQLEGLIRAYSMYTGVDQAGGVYLRAADAMPEEDQVLLQAAARVSLIAARGPLAQQLGAPYESVELEDDFPKRDAAEELSRPLPYLELPYFNSLGGFTPDGREYAIYLGPDTHTPAPWVNVIANPAFGTLVSETGAGFTWYGNSQRNRLTEWSNDPVLDSPSEVVYVRDEESGAWWSPTPSPVRERSAYRARHGAGYTVFEHNSHGIEQVYTVFVPLDDAGGEPVRLGLLRLRNDSSRPRTLSVTYYVEWTLGENRETSQQHVVTQWDREVQALFARNGYHPEFGARVAFAALTPFPTSYTADRTAFLGRNRGPHNPAAMRRRQLSERVGGQLDPCAAMRTEVRILPGESVEVVCCLGEAETAEEARGLVRKYRQNLQAAEALERARAWWDRLLGAVQVQTPDLSVNFLINRWLLYQSLSCRLWARSGFYQSGGAYGFRDQLQDVLALLIARPELAREHILRSAARQFREGDVQHWWHASGGAGVRTRISDDLLWLPYATAQYVRVTGDAGILEARVPFLKLRVLEPDEYELLATPGVSDERATLFEHCRRAVERGLTSGPHGLPLIGTGDWNDGLNRVGAAGAGESVWLAWFLVDVLAGMEEMAKHVGEVQLADEYRRKASELSKVIEREAWDGRWYLRAFFDDGSPLGASINEEARIDSLPQSWAWLSGAAEEDHARTAIESAWRQLVREEERLALLFAPPFDHTEPSPGYVQAYPPGVRENGGQYTHAALWLAAAMARAGDGTRAERLLRLLNPVEQARDVGGVWRYMLEPYAVAADVYQLPGHHGQGGWSWYTGSAAWMYRVWIEEVLGLRLRPGGLHIAPVIPASWPAFTLQFRHGVALYEIRVENPDGVEQGVEWVELDGRRLEGAIVPLDSEPVKHSVLVRMGKAAVS